jgi:UDP-N-acetylglucosamine 2-epimerase (non-hydrolysing)
MPYLIHLIVATRPNFMKAAPLYLALKDHPQFDIKLIHTGQHYDANMSDIFLRQLGLPDPDYYLDVKGGSHAEQTGQVMMAYEKICLDMRPDLTIVLGDVNSTAACTIAAKKLHIDVAHLEAGLRSFDRTMPEEINRLITDSIADIFWTPSSDADQHLINEGHAPEKIIQVGNIMIDSLELQRKAIENSPETENLKKDYTVVTLHRPSNVDIQLKLRNIVDELLALENKIDLIWPVHPRTRARLKEYDLWDRLENSSHMTLMDPLGYVEFMRLVFGAKAVLTDSGGIQEETTYLGIPCLTLRANTERPITISEGTNRLIDPSQIATRISEIMRGEFDIKGPPALWDGRAANRIVEYMTDYFSISSKKLALME